MANRIHKMSVELSNKIAAGEVVQRPASAVKELIENSIDAGAGRIAVIIKDAGSSLIHIVDDGEGMAPDDALLAFERHATSKIRSVDDLESLATLGFRGEALASIASIAHVELKTRTRDADVGTLIRIEGSLLKEQSQTGIEPGTSISIRHLFFNTPARRNFLKSPVTELKNISDVVTRMAVAHPEISWLYQNDETVVLDLKAKSFEGRLLDVFGERQFQSFVKLHEEHEFITLDGFIGKPDFVRKSRIEQFLYLNRRFIQNKAINHAVFQAYEHLIVKGGYPFFVLNVVIDPAKVDVNVHPSKMEVKFEDEGAIYRFVLHAVRKTLKEHQLFPAVSLGTGPEEADAPMRFESTRMQETPRFDEAAQAGGIARILQFPEQQRQQPVVASARQQAPAPEQHAMTLPVAPPRPIGTREVVLSNEAAGRQEPSQEGAAVWQLHRKYILSQVKTGLLIIDQHVAHERILYEKYYKRFENSVPSSQQLLFPQTIELTPTDFALVQELAPLLESLGFVMKPFGKTTVMMEGVPADVRMGDESTILKDVLDEFRENRQRGIIDLRDNLAKSFACKAAVKAGDRLTQQEMVSVIEQLFQTSMPYACPHGRPVVVRLTLDELDKRFGRT